jgi:hypothetical protein
MEHLFKAETQHSTSQQAACSITALQAMVLSQQQYTALL